jgi:hypothetical protein
VEYVPEVPEIVQVYWEGFDAMSGISFVAGDHEPEPEEAVFVGPVPEQSQDFSRAQPPRFVLFEDPLPVKGLG